MPFMLWIAVPLAFYNQLIQQLHGLVGIVEFSRQICFSEYEFPRLFIFTAVSIAILYVLV